METLEKIRETMLLEGRKRDNENTVVAMMEKTFAHRRQEIICDAPSIAHFKTRRPALFCMRNVTGLRESGGGPKRSYSQESGGNTRQALFSE